VKDIEKVQTAVAYIERNLSKDITLKELGNLTNYSAYHFHRMFQAVVGDPIGVYIRKRRIAKSKDDLINTDKKVIEIALNRNFKSQDTFTRAFKKLYGVTPGEFKRSKSRTEMDMPTLSDSEAEKLFQPRIVYKEEFAVVGIQTLVSFNDIDLSFQNSSAGRIQKMQNDFFSKQIFDIPHRINPQLFITGGIGCGDYGLTMACAEVENIDQIPPGMVGRMIPSNTYAVFTFKGNTSPEKIGPPELAPMYSYAYDVWLKDSDYQVIDSFSFELWDMSSASEKYCKAELYIPIKLRGETAL